MNEEINTVYDDAIAYEIVPVSVADIGDFVQSVINAFDDALFLSFSLMITFSIAFWIKRILVGKTSL